MLFISSEKPLSFLRYSNFCIFVFPSFYVSHWLRGWSKINLEVYDVSNCLNKNFIYFVWYLEKEKRYNIETLSIDRVLRKEHFYGKKHAENVHQKLVPDTFLILVYNSKQLLHARNCFKKALKKLNLFFLSNLIPFSEQDHEKQKGPERWLFFIILHNP